MSAPAKSAANEPATRTVEHREHEATAPLRCTCYAVLSELAASPHDIDSRDALREKIGAAESLGYGDELDGLIGEFAGTELTLLKREYSGLFEVGNEGPPVPIREDLQTGQRAGTREDLIRFYSFFKYSLDEKFAWAPDHLSVELEFMHLLCYREATDDTNALSYQLAQFDFSTRHLARWVPGLAQKVETLAPGSLYSRVISAASAFIGQDLEWQAGTIVAGVVEDHKPVGESASEADKSQ